MIEQTEKKSRLVRWWIGTATSLMVLGFGGYLLLMRYALGHNPLGDGYWAITGLVLAFGAFRVGMQLWRRKYLFDDTTEGDNFKIKSTIPLLLISILLQGLGGCATPSIQEKWLILRSAERFQDIKTIVILAERNNSKKDIYDTTNAIIVGILRKDFNLQTIPVDTLSIIATYNADSIIKSHNADAVLYYSIGGLVNLVSRSIEYNLYILMNDGKEGNLLEAQYTVGKGKMYDPWSNGIDYDLVRRSIEQMMHQAYNPGRRH